MNDFKIRRGLYSQLFNEAGNIRRDSVILELGCWYLCIDEALLFLCIEGNEGQLDLKQINKSTAPVNKPTTTPPEDNTGAGVTARSIIDAFIDEETGMLHLIFSDDTEDTLGPVVGTSGKDGLVTTIRVGNSDYSHIDGVISLPSFVTAEDLANDYAKKTDIPDVSGFIKEIPSEYITENELTAKGYLTEHQSLKDYSKTTEITHMIQEAVTVKANNVLFTTAKFISNPIGNFNVGDNIKGFTIAEIFAKLLGLTDVGPNAPEPPEPEIPEGLGGIVGTIMENRIPMFAVAVDGELEEIPFEYINFDPESAKLEPTKSGFYQVIDSDGQVLESGYQEIQVANDDIYYAVALPKNLDYNTMVSLQCYDPNFNIWSPAQIPMTNDTEIVAELCAEAGINISHIDTTNYTIWIAEESPTGSKLRYTIKTNV